MISTDGMAQRLLSVAGGALPPAPGGGAPDLAPEGGSGSSSSGAWPDGIRGGFAVGLAAVWVAACAAAAATARRRCAAAAGEWDPDAVKARQNRVYKRGGAALLLCGALGGFAPSLTLACVHRHAWSTWDMTPHWSADGWLYAHMAMAVSWVVLASAQLWTGGVATRARAHRAMGYAAATAAVAGIAGIGGWVWTTLHDFGDDYDPGNLGAGLYTVFLGMMIAGNAVTCVAKARARDFAAHKDHALMTIMWTVDPGLQRFWIWVVRMVYWDGWHGDAAFHAHNLTLVAWTWVTACAAGRRNATVLGQGLVQWLLWFFGTVTDVLDIWGPGPAAAVAASCAAAGVCAVWAERRAVRAATDAENAVDPSCVQGER